MICIMERKPDTFASELEEMIKSFENMEKRMRIDGESTGSRYFTGLAEGYRLAKEAVQELYDKNYKGVKNDE